MSKRAPDDIKREFPIVGSVPGWFFRVHEVSAGHYLAEGTDLWGRSVSHSGDDPDQLLERCLSYARGLQPKTQ